MMSHTIFKRPSIQSSTRRNDSDFSYRTKSFNQTFLDQRASSHILPDTVAKHYSILQKSISHDLEPWSRSENLFYESFPGGMHALQKIINQTTNPDITRLTGRKCLEYCIHNKILDKTQLVLWHKNLQRLDESEDIKQYMSLLTMATKINHIAFSPDGDRRWAIQRNYAPSFGHKVLFIDKTPEVALKLFQMGVHTFSLYCCSEANLLTRDKYQLVDLLSFVGQGLDIFLEHSHKMQIKISGLGNREIHTEAHDDVKYCFNQLIKKLMDVEHQTKHYIQHQMNFAINYDGEDDLSRAVKKMVHNNFNFFNLKRGDLRKYTDLGSSGQLHPKPDIHIRPACAGQGGRTSGAYLLETADTHVYFTPKLAPEIDFEMILASVTSCSHPLSTYRSRDHKKGGTM